MASERMRQVNEELRTRVAQIISQEMELPLGSFVTINTVETSRDLKHARVYVTVLPDSMRGSTMEYLKRHTARIQKLLGRKLTMKFTPRLNFILDERQIKAQGIFDAMDSSSD